MAHSDVVLRALEPWKDLIKIYADKYNLDPNIVAGVVYQESGGNAYAFRPEPGFWRRYYDGIMRLVRRTKNKFDDRWAKYPDVASASYGLMQPLYVVALEHGTVLRYPTELCDPCRNLDLGCKHLRQKIDSVGGDVNKGLLRYNGGGDKNYPQKIFNHSAHVAKANWYPLGSTEV